MCDLSEVYERNEKLYLSSCCRPYGRYLGADLYLFIDVILEVGRAINIYATNALRATGDVNYPFYVGFVVQWSVAVGCGFLFGIHWGWGLVGMWCAFVLDENLRGIIFVQRWNSLKWTKKGFVK